MALESHIIESFDNIVSSQSILFPHCGRGGIAIRKRFDGGLLGDNAGAHNRILVDLHHRFDELGGTARIANPESGHCESLRESMEENRSLSHSWKGSNADVLTFEGQF